MATRTPDARTASALESLADVLWVERHMVEYLLFKLTAAKLFLAADERRFIALALDEVERVVTRLRGAEEDRERVLDAVGEVLGVPAETLTLDELVTRAGEPLRSVFREHHEAFTRLAAEIEDTTTTNRRLASESLGHVRSALDTLTGPPDATTYSADGRRNAATPPALRLDQAL